MSLCGPIQSLEYDYELFEITGEEQSILIVIGYTLGPYLRFQNSDNFKSKHFMFLKEFGDLMKIRDCKLKV